MRVILRVLPVFLVVAHVAGSNAIRTFNDDPVGSRPPGFVFTAIREASSDRWTVERDADNRFLTHAPDPSPGFALAILDNVLCKDLAISARLKFTSGNGEGGVVWRYQDAGNFYMARLDLHDQKMAAYRVIHGNRIRIEGKEDLELDPSAWHALRVVHENERIRVYLGGIKVFDTVDRTYRQSGGVGLWASGETTVSFDDFRVEDR